MVLTTCLRWIASKNKGLNYATSANVRELITKSESSKGVFKALFDPAVTAAAASPQ